MNNHNAYLVFLVVFCGSLLLLAWLPELPSLEEYLGLGSLLLLSALLMQRPGSGDWRQYISPTLLALSLAWGWGMGWGHYQLAQQLPAAWEGEDLLIEGHIISLPAEHPSYSSFYFRPTQILAAPASTKPAVRKIQNLRLNWYDKPPEQTLIPGQHWRFVVRLKRSWTWRNPGGFDYEGWALRDGLAARGYVRSAAEFLGSTNKNWLTKQRWLIREKLIALELPALGLISGLMLGERSLLSPEEYLTLRRSGISHLLAISGLHLTLAGGLSFLVSFLIFSYASLWRGKNTLSLRLAAGCSMLFVWLYALWTGFSLPTQRAAVMVSMLLLAILTRNYQRPLFIYLLAMALVLLIDPLAATSGGFYLSFAAVALVILSIKQLIPLLKPLSLRHPSGFKDKLVSYCFDLLVSQWVLVAGLMPLTLIFFNEFSLLGILINLVAIPLTSFIIMPLLLLANLLLFIAPNLGEHLLVVLATGMDWLYTGLVSLNELPLVYFTRATPKMLAMLLAVSGLLVLFWGLRPYNYLLLLFLLLPSLFPTTKQLAPGELKVTFLDVGQGLAVHLQTAEHQLIYDTGAAFSSGSNLGQLVLVPYLKHLGIEELTTLVVSHKDLDHSGGLRGLLESIKVELLLANFPLEADGIILPRHHEDCRKGRQWQWDGIDFRVLHPPPETSYKNRNDNSCVLLVQTGESSLLLTGDITKQSEALLAVEFPDLQVELLQAPHHGSKSSSSVSWLAQLRPQHAVFSAGYRNRFHHPAAEVVARYAQHNITNWTSWQEGSLSFLLTNNTVTHLASHRRHHKRYWHRVVARPKPDL